jgi:hypothetical protein
MSGQVKNLPYPDACRVLEAMFPGWTAKELMAPHPDGATVGDPLSGNQDRVAQTLQAIAHNVASPESARITWHPIKHSSPDGHAAELPPVDRTTGDTAPDIPTIVGNSVLSLAKLRRLSDSETEQLASLAGNVVELALTLNIDIAPDGWAELTYHHELFNMSDQPLTRLAREVWFENTEGPVKIRPTDKEDRRIGIQRIHDTAHSAKFACQISPALLPGEIASISYTCSGGQFVSDHYWRQSIARYTRHFTLTLRHRGGEQLITCSAIEEHSNGGENLASEDLLWNYENNDVLITFTRDYLRPNQALTVRWEIDR